MCLFAIMQHVHLSHICCANVQIDGFKKALSRGGGANRFLRYLSRKKDGSQAANADTITLDDMLTFSPVRCSLHDCLVEAGRYVVHARLCLFMLSLVSQRVARDAQHFACLPIDYEMGSGACMVNPGARCRFVSAVASGVGVGLALDKQLLLLLHAAVPLPGAGTWWCAKVMV